MPPPSDDRALLTEFTLTRRVLLEWTVLGTGATLIAAVVFAAIFGIGTGQESVEFQIESGDMIVIGVVLFSLSIIGVIIVHEVIHAVLLRYYGGDVSYGVGLAEFVLPYTYITTTRNLTRNQFIIVALAPLIVITSVGVALMIGLTAR